MPREPHKSWSNPFSFIKRALCLYKGLHIVSYSSSTEENCWRIEFKHINTYMHEQRHKHTHTWIRTHKHTQAHTHINALAQERAHMHSKYVPVRKRVHTHTYTNARAHTHAHCHYKQLLVHVHFYRPKHECLKAYLGQHDCVCLNV